MIKKRHKFLTVLMVLILTLSISITAFADTVRITDRNPDYEYFDYYSSSGSWTGLLTPKHLVRDSNPEIVAYCLEHEADRPGSTYYDSTTSPFTYLDGTTYKGLLIILEYGYPYNTPSNLNADQTRYATANAIRFWLSERGMPNQYNFTNLSGIDINTLWSTGSVSGCSIRSNSSPSSLDTLRFSIDLLKKARSGQRIDHSISFSPSSLDVTRNGNNYVANTTVTLINLRGGYILDASTLPQGSIVTGYSGNSGDNLTISIPVSAVTGGQSFSITASGSDNRVPANLYWAINPSDPAKQDVVYMGTEFRPVGTGTLNISTPNLGFIEINKADVDTGIKLKDAVFNVVDSDSIVVDTLTTDANGYDISVELIAGTYSLQEITAPYGYVLDITPHGDIMVTANNTTTVNITNMAQTGIIEIIKQDSETGDISQGSATLNGAVFEIYDLNDTLIEQLDSIDSNIVQSSELPLGDYVVKEVTAPYGYILNDTSYPVTIEYTDQTVSINRKTVIIHDDVVKGNIAITKTGDFISGVTILSSEYGDVYEPIITQQAIEGVVFDVYDTDNNLVETLTTGADGTATSSNLPLGIYTLVEGYAPDGYVLDDTPIEIEFEYNDQTIALINENVVLNNSLQSVNVNLSKEREVISWNTLEYSYMPSGTGYTFGIYSKQDVLSSTGEVLIAKDSLIAYKETDENGNIAFDAVLPFGTYYLQEIACPSIYSLDGTKYEFQINPQTCDITTINININDGNPVYNNLIKKVLQIKKVDSRDSSIDLSEAKFEIINMQSDVIQTITTNDNGIAVSSPLPIGDYTFREIKAPDGYIFDGTEHEISLTNDSSYTYNVTRENDPTEVTIYKLAKDIGLPLANMKVGIYDAADNLVFEGVTDEEGKVTFYCLSVGKYTFKELVAPDGYYINPIVFDFELLTNGDVIGETTIENEPTKVILTKTDLLDGSIVPNAEIGIINSQNEVVFTGLTDENGALTITHLPIGTYTFKETKAPDGYILSEDIMTFTIDEFGVVTGKTELKNSPTTLEVYKVIYETEEPLNDAGFKVKSVMGLKTLRFTKTENGAYRLNLNGDIEEMFVDENGKITIYSLPFGSYWLEESTVPTDYFPSAAKKVTIDDKSSTAVPCKAIIPNSKFVKLGLDRDKYNVPIAIGLTLTTLAGLVFFFIRRKKRTR